MPRGVGDRDRAALRHPHEGELLEPGRLDDGLEIGDAGFEAVVGRAGVGEAMAALVVAHDVRDRAEVLEEVPPHRAFPVELEVTEPAGRDDERRSCAVARPCDARAVGRPAEAELLRGHGTHLGVHGAIVLRG
jgi:hypothetical protein